MIRLLSGALATLGTVALVVAPVVDLPAAAGGSSASTVTETPLSVPPPRSDAPGLMSASRSDDVVTVDDDFELVGAAWNSGRLDDAVVLEVRAHTRDGWTDWFRLEAPDIGPDLGTIEAERLQPTTEPVWVGPSDAAQVRVRGPAPAGLRLLTVDGQERAADAGPANGGPLASADAAAARPYVVTRAQWGADESLKSPECRKPTYNTDVKVIFVHHTVDSNTYSASQVPMMMRNLYSYALRSGYCDIQYNVIADRYGQLWEARAGGIDRAVRSGATGGFNKDSWAVSMLGNFSTATVPAATYNAVRDLIAWKAGVHGLNPRGTQTLVSSGAAGTTSRYPDGKSVRLDVISGHRDVGLTECPGNHAYPMLARLRGELAAAAPVNPVGSLDAVRTSFNTIHVEGWTLDPETATPSYVWVDVSGQGQPGLADRDRPDVGRAYPSHGSKHGFGVSVARPTGTYRVCVWGVNQRAGADTLLGCQDVTVTGEPTGQLEAVHPALAGATVAGWTVDPDTTGPTYVWIDVAGHGFPVLADRSRPDVAKAYAGYGDRHGFTATVPLKPGTSSVCAWAVNSGPGSDTALGCRSVTVSPQPGGALDAVSATSGKLSVAGWAIDPETPAPLYVWVDVSGQGFPVMADRSRPDIAAAFVGHGAAHGFDHTVAKPRGTYTVCAWAVNVGAGSDQPIGCRRVTVP